MSGARHAARLLVLGGATLGLGTLLALGFGDEAHAADTPPLADTTATVTTTVVDTATPVLPTGPARPGRTADWKRPAVERTDRPASPPASLTGDKPAPRRPLTRVVDTTTAEVSKATRSVVDQAADVTDDVQTLTREAVEHLPRIPAPTSPASRVIELTQLHPLPAAKPATRPVLATGSARTVNRTPTPAALPSSPLIYQHPGQGSPSQQPSPPQRAATAMLTAATAQAHSRPSSTGWALDRVDRGLDASSPPKPTDAALTDVWHPRAPAAHSPPATTDALAGRTTRPSPPTG